MAHPDMLMQQLSAEKQELLRKRLRGAGARVGGGIPRRGSDDPAPLSFGQQRLWFLEQLSPGNPFYNIPLALRLHSYVDVVAAESALKEIARRHECLRSRFVVTDGEPWQVVDREAKVPLRVIDLRRVPDTARDAEAVKLAADEARAPFDLSKAPLVRASLLRLGEYDYVFLLTMHHIVSDGWSMGIFARELTASYAAFAAGLQSPLPKLPLQYADFAAWQRQQLRDDVLAEPLAYWKRKLANVPPLSLPADHPRPPVQQFRGGHHDLAISATSLDALSAFCSREGVTLFMALLATFKLLLHRYTGQKDIAVGTYIAGRDRPELEELIGFFLNTLVLRTSIQGDPTFRELLGRVRETAVEAYEYQQVPFEKLVEELKPERDWSRNPLCQVAFQLQNATAVSNPGFAPADSGPSGSALAVDRGGSIFDLAISAWESAEGVRLHFEYSADLFDPGTIARMAEHYDRLLGQVVRDCTRPVSAYALLSGRERHRILFDWNATARQYSTAPGLREMFEQQAERTPDAAAFLWRGQTLCYRELDRRASQIAGVLQARGAGPESVVAICLERSFDFAIALLGVIKAGAAFLAVDPNSPPSRAEFMLRDSGATAVLTKVEMEASLSAPAEFKPTVLSPQSLAYLIYTSGSTGRPKGVAVEQRQLLNRLHWMWEAYPFRENEVCCQKTAQTFVDAIWEWLGPLLRGTPTFVLDECDVRDPSRFIARLAGHRVTRLWLVPSLLRMMLDTCGDLGARLPSLDFWVSSGEPLPPELLRRFESAAPSAKLYNLYGASEVWDVTWQAPPEAGGFASCVPIGHPIANIKAHILDEQQEPVPAGVPGELYVGGAALARGYVNQPALTAAKFIPDPFATTPGARLYRTGDLARYLPGGAIDFMGRRDLQVKIRGYRVEPAEVEGQLECHNAIKQAIVIPSVVAGEPRLIAYVVLDGESTAASADIKAFLERSLPPAMIPSVIKTVPVMPLNASGKVDRAGLTAPEQVISEAGEYVPPRTADEEKIAGIWLQVLGAKPIGVDDHFFNDLGGHSLLAAQVITRLRDAFQVEAPMRLMFEAPTVASLAAAIRALTGGRTGPAEPARAIPRLDREKYRGTGMETSR